MSAIYLTPFGYIISLDHIKYIKPDIVCIDLVFEKMDSFSCSIGAVIHFNDYVNPLLIKKLDINVPFDFKGFKFEDNNDRDKFLIQEVKKMDFYIDFKSKVDEIIKVWTEYRDDDTIRKIIFMQNINKQQ